MKCRYCRDKITIAIAFEKPNDEETALVLCSKCIARSEYT